MKNAPKHSIDLLRDLVNTFDCRNEYLNTDKSVEQLVSEYTDYLNDKCDVDGNYFEDEPNVGNYSEELTEEITPRQAQDLLYSVRKDLDTLIALGESYAHFQSAQATHKYLKKAKKALEGLS